MEQCLVPSEIKKPGIAERMLLVQEIWDSIATEQHLFEMAETPKAELDRRIAAYDASSDESRSWEEIRHGLGTSN